MVYTLVEHRTMYEFYKKAPRANKQARQKALGHLLVCKLMSRATNPFPVDYKKAFAAIK
jgi:hypothetical protein